MKINELVTDIKAWIAFVVVLGSLGIGIAGWASTPQKVKDLDNKVKEQKEEIQDTKSSVDKLASTVDKYVALQEAQKKDQEKREDMMLEMIKLMNEGKKK